MNNISVNYDLKWQYKPAPWYKWTTCGKLFNARTGRKIKKTVNGRSVGYWLAGKFCPLSRLRTQLEIIPKKQDFTF